MHSNRMWNSSTAKLASSCQRVATEVKRCGKYSCSEGTSCCSIGKVVLNCQRVAIMSYHSAKQEHLQSIFLYILSKMHIRSHSIVPMAHTARQLSKKGSLFANVIYVWMLLVVHWCNPEMKFVLYKTSVFDGYPRPLAHHESPFVFTCLRVITSMTKLRVFRRAGYHGIDIVSVLCFYK